jgi:RNA polymerase sigma factor (sigma-70 family)
MRTLHLVPPPAADDAGPAPGTPASVLQASDPGAAPASPGSPPAPRPALTPEQQRYIQHGLALVERGAIAIARSYHPIVRREELLGPGTIALYEAVHAYRQELHPSFLQYAQYHVCGRMLDAVRVEHCSLRARVERAMDHIFYRMISHQELALDLFSDPPEKIQEGARRGSADLAAATYLAALLEGQQASVEDQIVELEGQVATLALLHEGLASLNPYEREMISKIYEEKLTLEEISKQVLVPTRSCQRRHASALRKLEGFLTRRGATGARRLDLALGASR